MDAKQFNELVWDFGANGIENPSLCNEEQWQIVAMAWAEANNKETEEEADAVIDSYYKDFQNAE